MTSRAFPLPDILTTATGRYCTPSGLDGVAAVCAWMTGESPMTHQMPRFSRECEDAIYAQHPDLRQITVPQFSSEQEGMAWVAAIVAEYGETRELTPMPTTDHTRIGPIAEFRMHNKTAEIITVDTDN